VVLKAGKYMNDYDVTATANPSSADYGTWAYSISGEMGKRIDLGKGLYVEPQAELILGRLNGADYTTSTGMNVSVDAQNKAITRLGLAFGKSYTRGSLYGKFSYYHDFGSGVDLNAADGGNSVGYSEDMARNWTELTIGGSAKLGKNANAYAEVSKYMGQLSSNIDITSAQDGVSDCKLGTECPTSGLL
jgi:outer membrane autotransporter protein